MRTLITLALALSTLGLAAQAPKKPEPAKPAAAKAEAKPAPKAEPKAAPASAFVGNKETKTFHKGDCKMAAKMKAEKKQSFATKAEAEKAGFKACKVCKP